MLKAFPLLLFLGPAFTSFAVENEPETGVSAPTYYVPEKDPEGLKKSAAEILSDDRYELVREKPSLWRQMLLFKALKYLGRVFDWIANMNRDYPVIYALTVTAMALLLALMVIHILRRTATAKKPEEEHDPALMRFFSEALGWRDLRKRAAEEAAAGNYVDAVRWLFLSAALFLVRDDAKRIDARRFRRHMTYRELARAAAVSVQQKRELEKLVGPIERGFYGRTDLTGDEYRLLDEIYRGLIDREQQ